MHSAEQVRDTTLDDEHSSQHVTSVLVTELCNHPEALASDLVDDQSRYLFFSGEMPITRQKHPCILTHFDMGLCGCV